MASCDVALSASERFTLLPVLLRNGRCKDNPKVPLHASYFHVTGLTSAMIVSKANSAFVVDVSCEIIHKKAMEESPPSSLPPPTSDCAPRNQHCLSSVWDPFNIHGTGIKSRRDSSSASAWEANCTHSGTCVSINARLLGDLKSSFWP